MENAEIEKIIDRKLTLSEQCDKIDANMNYQKRRELMRKVVKDNLCNRKMPLETK